MHAKSLQSCPALRELMDGGLLGSSVHGIFQARTLEWVAMPSSRGSSGSRHQTLVSCLLRQQVDSLTLVPPGAPGRYPTYDKTECQPTTAIYEVSTMSQAMCYMIHIYSIF